MHRGEEDESGSSLQARAGPNVFETLAMPLGTYCKFCELTE